MRDSGADYRIGHITCRVCNDGTLVNPASDDVEIFGLNCMLVDTGEHKILIDTGCGAGFQTTAGKLVQALEADGIDREDITKVIFTHGHIDHVGGACTDNGQPVFPNARYAVLAREWEFWLSEPANNDLEKMLFETARNNLVPQKKRFDLFEDGAEIVDGVKLIGAPGHSPGHAMVEISSGQERLLCISDIIHSPREFVNPECLALFDVDPKLAVETRANILAGVSASRCPVFACHFLFPGLGYIESQAGRFRWQAMQLT